MNSFFLAIEILMPMLALYFIWVKGGLSVVYFPLYMFSSAIVDKNFPASFNYLLFSGLILYYIYTHPTFAKRNIFAIALVFHYLFLMPNSKDLVKIRPDLFGVITLFLLVPIIADVYKKHPRNQISSEVDKMAFLVVLMFVMNSIFSTLFGYNPRGIYGISSGILYGFLSFDVLNILPFAIFIVIRKGMKDRNFWYLVVYLVAIFFILLTFRRTVMVLCVLGTIIVMIELLNVKQIGSFLVYGVVIGLVSAFVIYQTGFLDVFWERYNMRDLDNRPLNEEKRLMELEILYKDLFVHYDYDPWFGYELFDSNRNYGKGAFGNRTLHTDFGTIIHSSGLIGFTLYVLMIFTAFGSVWSRIETKSDYLQFAFCLVCFGVFFITGRYTTVSAMTLMFCLIYLPLGMSSRKIKIMQNDKALNENRSL